MPSHQNGVNTSPRLNGVTTLLFIRLRVTPHLKLYTVVLLLPCQGIFWATLKLKLLITCLAQDLQKAQDRMKAMADAHRRDVQYEVGAWVYVKLRPYRQTLLKDKTPQKLAKRYFGPFQILSRIGLVAYRLDLPDTSKIHLVFHYSVLKAHSGSPPQEPGTLPLGTYNNGPLLSPLVILGTRETTTNDSPQLEVLVQWQGLSPEEATWEPWGDIQRTFNLENKVLLPDVTNDATVTKEENGPIEAGSTTPKRRITRPSNWKDYVH